MAFLRQVGDTTPEEALIYTYWTTVLHLLKLGIAWDAILSFTEGEIALILGIQSALDQRQSEEEAREMAKSHSGMLNRMGA